MWEWSNLHEFLAVASLVTISTTFVIAFRYAIYVFERRGREEIQRRQPEWDAFRARSTGQNEQIQ
jgi:hypothetical protein